MHYGNYAFSKNNKPTSRAIKDHSISLGNSKGLSELDIVKLNALYDCASEFIYFETLLILPVLDCFGTKILVMEFTF